jgi:hypothetical protein
VPPVAKRKQKKSFKNAIIRLDNGMSRDASNRTRKSTNVGDGDLQKQRQLFFDLRSIRIAFENLEEEEEEEEEESDMLSWKERKHSVKKSCLRSTYEANRPHNSNNTRGK